MILWVHLECIGFIVHVLINNGGIWLCMRLLWLHEVRIVLCFDKRLNFQFRGPFRGKPTTPSLGSCTLEVRSRSSLDGSSLACRWWRLIDLPPGWWGWGRHETTSSWQANFSPSMPHGRWRCPRGRSKYSWGRRSNYASSTQLGWRRHHLTSHVFSSTEATRTTFCINVAPSPGRCRTAVAGRWDLLRGSPPWWRSNACFRLAGATCLISKAARQCAIVISPA
mmetsp:Transcript_14508/g.36774  ORF Transcript_14508/g.36774 Transcript_14508/m.36774 type:complete len:223 (-) Transcript_14508:581-1249(-)